MTTLQAAFEKIREETEKAVVGQEKALELLLVGLLSGGHVLLEDVPGVGKTTLLKTLAACVGCRFKRIQCTPDLLPSDVTGTMVYHPSTGQFRFREGPLFSQIVLADEVNRAVPRTQSAFLEAMAEGQVTVDGEPRPLDRPFFLMATQNPVESQGTFPLPEAQLDRFLMKVSLGYPGLEEERRILRMIGGGNGRDEVRPVIGPEDVLALQEEVRRIRLSEDVETYLLEVVRRTRDRDGVVLGASPRAAVALGTAVRALAGIRGREYVIPDDVKYLAPWVLAHRLVLASDLRMERVTPESVVLDVLKEVPVPVEDDAETSAIEK
ncbi:MAG: MoxR family ATPase [Planifilum fimeticola]